MVQLGVERLLSSTRNLLAGDRVGLVTNPTGVDSRIRSTIDLLYEAEDIDLRRLFGPEHGIRGAAAAAEAVPDSRDEHTGLPVTSLYGDRRRPTGDDLADLDAVVYDLQDVGARYYTLIATLANVLEAAAEFGVRVVVLDRPNPVAPLGVAGNRIPDEYASFLGGYRLPVCHGMTPGEVARYVAGEYDVDVDLSVVELSGWSREQWYDETGLPWVAPSPNVPTLDTATAYPGTCLFEQTTLSEGRGTTRPFELVGAPWIDAREWADTLNDAELEGVRFRPAHFRPGASKHEGETVGGVQVHVRDRDAVDPLAVGLAMLVSAFRDFPETGWRPRAEEGFVDRYAGGPFLRKTVENLSGDESLERVLEELREGWADEQATFLSDRRPYELY
jgi:beta-N-acetylhexosaminidase